MRCLPTVQPLSLPGGAAKCGGKMFKTSDILQPQNEIALDLDWRSNPSCAEKVKVSVAHQHWAKACELRTLHHQKQKIVWINENHRHILFQILFPSDDWGIKPWKNIGCSYAGTLGITRRASLKPDKTSQGKFIGNFRVCQLHHTYTIHRCEFNSPKQMLKDVLGSWG